MPSAARFFKGPYHADVMKTFLMAKSTAVFVKIRIYL